MSEPNGDRTETPPILVLDGFLRDDEHQMLIDHARTHQDDLVAGGVLNEKTGGGVDHDVRKSSVGPATDTVIAPFSDRLNALLPHLRKELGIDWFPLSSIEAQFTVHGDGDFFAIHTDDGTVATQGRKLTFVYYFHVPPRGFDGGELVVYDWKYEGRFVGPGDVAHTVEPSDNSIVFFPSNAYHEVRPVRVRGNHPDDYRFTVNGWFHSALTTADVEPVDRLTDAQRLVVPRHRDTSFELLDTDPDLHHRFVDQWHRSMNNPVPEIADQRIYPEGSPQQTPLGLDPDALLADLLAEHEAWAGTTLEPTAVVGYRTFRTGQTERPHASRVESHVITSLYCLSIEGADDSEAEHDEQSDAPCGPRRSWPVALYDQDGVEHEIDLQPGQVLRYESASCAVGHQQPLIDGTATYLMIHYRPTDWDWSEPKVWDAVAAHYRNAPTTEDQ